LTTRYSSIRNKLALNFGDSRSVGIVRLRSNGRGGTLTLTLTLY
jgi:hypothetical protein